MLRSWGILIVFLLVNTQASTFDIANTVIKKPIVKGVSMEEAIDSMKLRANALNMKLVGHQALSEELKARGATNVRRLEIFHFCEPQIAQEMVTSNMNLAAYLPCRITLVEDEQGYGWLVMMDLDFLIQAASLPPRLQELAIKVRDNLKQIIEAGAKGEL